MISLRRVVERCSLSSPHPVIASSLAEPLEAAANASVRAERPDPEDDPADQAGVDRAGRLDRCGPRPSRSCATMDAASSSDSSTAVSSSTVSRLCGVGDERLELAVHLVELSGSSLLRDEPQEVAHELVRSRRRAPEERRLRGRIDLRVARGTRAARAVSIAPRRGEVAAHLLEPVPPPARRRRARARTCAAQRPWLVVSFSSAEKSSSAIASSMRRRWSSASRTLPVDPRGRLEREVGDLGADLVERRASSRPRSAAASPRAGAAAPPRLPPSRARSARPPTLRASARISPASRLACAMSARCCSSRSRASARALSASSTALRMRSRRSSIVLWMGPNAYFAEHEERDREADQRPDHEPRDDLDQILPRSLGGEEGRAHDQTRTYASSPPMRP